MRVALSRHAFSLYDSVATPAALVVVVVACAVSHWTPTTVWLDHVPPNV
jgi:hypothetical protein